MVSYFYGAVGTFQLGSLEKSSFTQRDWFFFVTQAYTFGSVYNCWAFLAVLSVLATQLNTLNLNQIFFPIQEDDSRRTVSPAIRVLSCGTIKERHGAEDDPTTPTADLLASDFTVLPAVAGGRQT